MASRSAQGAQRKVRKGKRRISDPSASSTVNEESNPWRRSATVSPKSPETSEPVSGSKMDSPTPSEMENGSKPEFSSANIESQSSSILKKTWNEIVQEDNREMNEKGVEDDTTLNGQSAGDEVNDQGSSPARLVEDSTSTPLSNGKLLNNNVGIGHNSALGDEGTETTGLGYALKFASDCLQSSNIFATKPLDSQTSKIEEEIVDSPSDDSRRKIYPLNEDAESDDSDSETNSKDIEQNGSKNDLSVDRVRTPGRKIKIIPPNVEVSPAASETSFDRTSVDCDPGCLTPGNDSAKTAGKRESVSEPLSAPPGFKMIATTMEIGIVRDVVLYAAILHDQLLQSDGLLGKGYNICYVTVTTGASVVALAATATGKMYEVLLPKFVSETGHKVQIKAWNKWTCLDEAVSFRVSNKLNKHPTVRKSLFEILGQVKETNFYQTFQAINNRIRSVVSSKVQE